PVSANISIASYRQAPERVIQTGDPYEFELRRRRSQKDSCPAAAEVKCRGRRLPNTALRFIQVLDRHGFRSVFSGLTPSVDASWIFAAENGPGLNEITLRRFLAQEFQPYRSIAKPGRFYLADDRIHVVSRIPMAMPTESHGKRHTQVNHQAMSNDRAQ